MRCAKFAAQSNSATFVEVKFAAADPAVEEPAIIEVEGYTKAYERTLAVDRLSYWQQNGAQLSPTVARLVKQHAAQQAA